MQFRLEDFKNEADHNTFTMPNSGIFGYTDGLEVERRIYNILLQTTDRSCFSAELMSKITDWPSEYHFSPLRHNLLRHVNFRPTDNILELGCGCGAITRQLGETGALVTAIEGSIDRAKCAAVRCEDLKNVSVYCANFQDVIFENKYDYVTLIGVLEYCQIFFNGDDDPIKSCLDIVKSALKPDGKLIIAIENRLGLKYFAGIEEDHVNIPFFGIQDLYTRKSAITFGKNELNSLLAQNDFCAVEFQYPFPDYKIPKAVFTEAAFSDEVFRPAEIIRQLPSRSYTNNTRHSFSENLVWPVLENNNLVTDLSNSFLVLASLTDHATTNNLLGIYYTVDRVKQFNVKTEFIKDGDSIVVNKSLISCEEQNNAETSLDIALKHKCYTELYKKGKSLDSEIKKCMYCSDFEGYIRCLKLWIDYLQKNGIKAQHNDIYRSTMIPDYFDCLPQNLILTSSGIEYIDREWQLDTDFMLTTVLLRYIDDVKQIDFVNKHLNTKCNNANQLLSHLGVSSDSDIYKDYNRINSLIYRHAYHDYTLFSNATLVRKSLRKLKKVAKKLFCNL